MRDMLQRWYVVCNKCEWLGNRAGLNGKKKVVPEHGSFKRARRHYMSSPGVPNCSTMFPSPKIVQEHNHMILAPHVFNDSI